MLSKALKLSSKTNILSLTQSARLFTTRSDQNSKINEGNIDNRLKMDRNERQKEELEKKNASREPTFSRDGQHSQYKSLTNQGSGNPDPSERERLRFKHMSEGK